MVLDAEFESKPQNRLTDDVIGRVMRETFLKSDVSGH